MISITDFNTLTIEDKSIFEDLYGKYPPVHSDYVFTTMISWMEYGKYKFTSYKDHIIIMTNVGNKIRFRPPIGKMDKELISDVLKLSKREGCEQPFDVIDPNAKKYISEYFPDITLIPDRNYFDYVYLSSDLAELQGNKYRKIRNRLNKFVKNYKYEVEKINEDNLKDVLKFLKRWCLWRDCGSDPLLENERKAIMYSIKHFVDLGLSGLNIIVNGNIEACAVYEKINTNTAVVHYEKGSPDYDGIYKVVNKETAMLIQNRYKYINRESDMGLSGLRKAKTSYNPDHMIEVFHINKDTIIL